MPYLIQVELYMCGFDKNFCREHCPYLKCDKERKNFRMKFRERNISFLTPESYASTFLFKPTTANMQQFPDCIVIHNKNMTQSLDRLMEIKKTNPIKFLEKHANLVTDAKNCPVYFEMIMSIFNK